ncbi:MAG: large repetitive protein [Acidobacteriota bacterium]|nr:large repetitive protein [Acidobacteriota bacterium]
MRLSAHITQRLNAAARSFARGGAARGTSVLVSFRSGVRLFALLFILLVVQSVSAQTNIYHIRGNATAGSNNLWSVDPTTGVETLVYSNYPGGNAATLAQRPSDGMIFYAINAAAGSNGAMYRFNPATPSVAPVLLGNVGPSTSGGNVGSGYRMAFLGNTLYFMPGGGAADNDTLYTLSQTTGQATAVATITGTGNGGDMAFLGNTLYIVNQNRQLYTASVAGGAATSVGTITFPGGITPNTIGVAFDSAGRLLLQTTSPSNLYRVTLPSLSAASFATLGGGTSATGDLATANVPAPDISVTKTDGVTNTYQGATATYTVTLKNNGAYTVSASLSDIVPASLTGVAWTCAASAGSTCNAASGSGNTISTGATLAASGTATYTVTGTVNVSSGTIANTASVSLDAAAWLVESNAANNSATDTDNVVPAADLSITKVAATAFAVDNTASYTLTVRNNGPQSASGTITVTDTLPAGLTSFTASGTGWTCANSSGTITCTMAGPLATGTNAPAITVTGTVGSAAAPNVSNTATVSNPTFDPTAANNSSTISTPVLYIKLDKSYMLGGPAPKPGTDIIYTIAFSNLGALPVQTLTIVDMVPYNTDFKVGSATFSYSTTPTITYSAAARTPVDPAPVPSPFTLYTPPGAAGTYDTQLNWVRWSFAGSIPVGATGTVSFTVRIK